MDNKLDYLKLTKREDFTAEVIKDMVAFFDRDDDHITPIWLLWRAGFTFDTVATWAEQIPEFGLDLNAIYDLEAALADELTRQNAQTEELNHEQNIQ